jgi:hypothetical protein
METREVIEALAAIERRAAGSDAERRAARMLALALRRGGRRATRVHTFWVRPAWAPLHALLCAVAIAGSVVSVNDAVVGLCLAGGALLALAGDLSGRVTLLRRLTFERATQNVVAPDPRGHEHAKVRLVLTAAIDAPRAGLAERGAAARIAARARRALHGHLPGMHGVAAGAMALLVACCAIRVGIADPPGALGAVQLLPTVVLILLLAMFLDHAAAPPARAGANADASATAAVLALAAALDRRPPANLAVDVVLAGAGHAQALGMRRWVRNARREGLRAEQVCVLHVAACGAGDPVWWTHDGLVLALRYHTRMLALAELVAGGEQALGAHPVRSHGTSGARAARARRWPALAVGALTRDDVVPHLGSDADSVEQVDLAAVDRTIAFTLALIAALDRDLAPAPAS